MAPLVSTSDERLLLHFDRERRRLWIANQRIHHGMTGALLAAAGALLMLHDRKDHSLWFQRGPQRQP